MAIKRYVVVLDAYIYAQDDEQAREIARLYAKHLDNYLGYEDNKAKAIQLCEQPFGTLESRKINLE